MWLKCMTEIAHSTPVLCIIFQSKCVILGIGIQHLTCFWGRDLRLLSVSITLTKLWPHRSMGAFCILVIRKVLCCYFSLLKDLTGSHLLLRWDLCPFLDCPYSVASLLCETLIISSVSWCQIKQFNAMISQGPGATSLGLKWNLLNYKNFSGKLNSVLHGLVLLHLEEERLWSWKWRE